MLDNYADRIVEVMDTEQAPARAQLFLAMLGDLQDLLAVTERLLNRHLSGNPEDVFYSEEEYLKLAQSRYSLPKEAT